MQSPQQQQQQEEEKIYTYQLKKQSTDKYWSIYFLLIISISLTIGII
jgi:hypothetical protein